MTAPTLHAFTAGTTPGSNETTSVVTTPTISNGEGFYIAMVSDLNTGQTFAFPGGWTELFHNINVVSAAGFDLAYKIASSEPGTISVTLGTAEKQVWVAFSITGDGGVLLNAVPQSGTASSFAVPGLTTTVNDCLLIAVIPTDVNAGTTLPHTLSGGWTKIGDQFASSAGAVSVWYLAAPTAGVYGPWTGGLAVSEQYWTNVFVIGPASSVYSDGVSLAKTVALTLVNAASTQEGVTIARVMAASTVSLASLVETATLALTRGLTLTGTVVLPVGVALNRVMALTEVYELIAFADLTLTAQRSQAETTDVAAGESVSLDLTREISVIDFAWLSEQLTLNRGLTLSNGYDLNAAVDLIVSKVLAVSNATTISAQESLELAAHLIFEGSDISPIYITLVVAKLLTIGPTTNIEAGETVSLTENRALSDTNNESSFNAFILQRTLTLITAATGNPNLALTLTKQLGFSVDSVATIHVPEIRTCFVLFQNRTVWVEAPPPRVVLVPTKEDTLGVPVLIQRRVLVETDYRTYWVTAKK